MANKIRSRSLLSRRLKKKRTFNGKVFGAKRAYSFDDIAESLNTHIRTVQRWRSDGLPILEGVKPFLVMGRYIQEFLKNQADKRKKPLQLGEFFCTKCQQPRRSDFENIRLEETQRRLGASHRQVIIHGICEVCATRLSLFSSEQKAACWRENARLPLERAETLRGNAGGSTNADITRKFTMIKVNAKNERTKRAFFRYLKNADGCCDSTVSSIENAILQWQDFSKDEDFAHYNADKAIEFKKWLVNRDNRGKPLALVTYHAYLRHMRKFFAWLTREPGYKSRIKPNAVDYLKATEKEERMVKQSKPRSYPSLEYVQKFVASIAIRNEIDQRDRALIAFTLLSGMRDQAIASLPLGCFDEKERLIVQNPRLGVRTKFSKLIPTTLFSFDDGMFRTVIEWVKHLKAKGFGSQDPMFPRAKMDQGKDSLSFESSTEVEPNYWNGAGRIREIFKTRSQQAGLPYYPPHTFRHLAINLAVKACRNGEEIKAISQNFGHEHIATTVTVYGNYTPSRLAEIIKEMDFSGKQPRTVSDEIKELKELIVKKQQLSTE